MKIALLSDLFYPYLLGGGERQFYEIGRRLAKKHEVHVFTLRLPGEKREEIVENMIIHRGGFVHPMDRRSFYQLLSVPLMFRDVTGFDVVHANQGMSMFFGLFRELIDKNERFVATFHDLYIDRWKIYYKFPLSLMGRTLEFLWTRSKYDSIISVSNATREKLKFFGLDSTVVPNGIDFGRYMSRKKEKTILYIGRLVKYKHVDELIRVMKKVQEKYDYKLKIIGMGEEFENLKRLSRKLGVDAEFLGFVPEDRKIEELSRAEIFVNPSTVEGFGIVLLEAMASGCKVVARPLPAYEFCTSKNSILTNDFYEGIITAINSKINGRDTARKYSWDRIVREIEKIYFSVRK